MEWWMAAILRNVCITCVSSLVSVHNMIWGQQGAQILVPASKKIHESRTPGSSNTDITFCFLKTHCNASPNGRTQPRPTVRVVTPSFVYRRGGVLTTLTAYSPIECRGNSGFGVNPAMQTLYTQNYTLGLQYQVDLASISIQASGLGHRDGCYAGKSSLMRSVSFLIYRRNVGNQNTTSSPNEAPRLPHQKQRSVIPGFRRRARCLAFRYPS